VGGLDLIFATDEGFDILIQLLGALLLAAFDVQGGRAASKGERLHLLARLAR
jgi:hypothetical protein